MIQKNFVPGSRWVYLKLYTGYKIADKILTHDIMFIIRRLKKMKKIEKWFYIRYSDPDFHLRIRLLMNDENDVGMVINLFYKRLNYHMKNNLIWKIQVDTYERELERYGGNLVEVAESIFCIQSEYIVAIIKKISTFSNENYRWMIALKLIDDFLTVFSFDILQKEQFIDKIREAFKKEFGFNKYNSKQLNWKFRKNKQLVESVLNNTIIDVNYIILYKITLKYNRRTRIVATSLRTKLKKIKEKIILETLLASYIHMMLNRLFRTKNRLHELVLYDFLARFYKSEIVKTARH